MHFDRRDFMKSLSAAVAVPSLAGALPASGHAAQAKAEAGPAARKRNDRPNVILMICDDLGYGDPGCYGSRLPTPNLDRMAAEGMRFTRYNSAHPICSASRAALLTGRYAQRSGTEGAYFPHSPTGTALDEQLLSNLFKDRGYKTACVGKWHLGDAPAYLPTSRGFDSYYGVPYSDDMKPLPLMRDLETLVPDADRDELTPLYTQQAVKFIEQSAADPFFLYMAFSYPHDPARASARFKGRSGFGDYGDSVMEIDWSVGEVTAAVEKAGIAADTLILFTSDHGPWYQGSPGNLRGRKASTFEGGFRVPFLAQWPGTVPPGKVIDNWTSSLDVLPSLVTLCGLEQPRKPLDGVDVTASLRGESPVADDRSRLYFSPIGNGNNVHCLRKGDWKLRVAQGQGGEIYTNDATTFAKKSAWLPHAELYNLRADPEESYDVAKLNAEKVRELMADLEAAMQTMPDAVRAAYAALKQDTGDIATPPGAAVRPLRKGPLPDWAWEPDDRR